jgi:hypothetical protein
MSQKNSNDTIGNRTRDLPVCSVVNNFDNTLVKFRTGIGDIYLPYAVDSVLATAVVAETPMEVEGVHNVVVI